MLPIPSWRCMMNSKGRMLAMSWFQDWYFQCLISLTSKIMPFFENSNNWNLVQLLTGYWECSKASFSRFIWIKNFFISQIRKKRKNYIEYISWCFCQKRRLYSERCKVSAKWIDIAWFCSRTCTCFSTTRKNLTSEKIIILNLLGSPSLIINCKGERFIVFMNLNKNSNLHGYTICNHRCNHTIGVVLLRYYLEERKKQPRNDKFCYSCNLNFPNKYNVCPKCGIKFGN